MSDKAFIFLSITDLRSLKDGMTALMYALQWGHDSTVAKLVSLGADIQRINPPTTQLFLMSLK